MQNDIYFFFSGGWLGGSSRDLRFGTGGRETSPRTTGWHQTHRRVVNDVCLKGSGGRICDIIAQREDAQNSVEIHFPLPMNNNNKKYLRFLGKSISSISFSHSRTLIQPELCASSRVILAVQFVFAQFFSFVESVVS